jgi:hypothetical protein
MALFPGSKERGNGQKKTRQGKGRGTKFGTKPQTHTSMFVSTKALKRYKKRYRGQGK